MNEKNVNNKKNPQWMSSRLKTADILEWRGDLRVMTAAKIGKLLLMVMWFLPLKESGLWNQGSFAVESVSSGDGSWKAD